MSDDGTAKARARHDRGHRAKNLLCNIIVAVDMVVCEEPPKEGGFVQEMLTVIKESAQACVEDIKELEKPD